jgi:hypothetical protein
VLVKQQAMKKYVRVVLQNHAFLASVLDEVLGSYGLDSGVDTRANMDAVNKEKPIAFAGI